MKFHNSHHTKLQVFSLTWQKLHILEMLKAMLKLHLNDFYTEIYCENGYLQAVRNKIEKNGK